MAYARARYKEQEPQPSMKPMSMYEAITFIRANGNEAVGIFCFYRKSRLTGELSREIYVPPNVFIPASQWMIFDAAQSADAVRKGQNELQ
jgi:hypothetical protein